MSARLARVVAFPERRVGVLASRRSAYDRFTDAIHGLAEHPTPDAAVRYLAASRALDESRRFRPETPPPEATGELPPAA